MQLLGFLKSIFTDKVNQTSSFSGRVSSGLTQEEILDSYDRAEAVKNNGKSLKETWVVRDIPPESGSTLNAYKESDLEGMEEYKKNLSEQYELAQKLRRQQREQNQERPLDAERPSQEYKNTPF